MASICASARLTSDTQILCNTERGDVKDNTVVAPPLVSAEALAASTAAPLLIDLGPAEQFAAGQIPGAVHLDLWGVSLIDTSEAPLAAFMWMIAHLFELRGVTNDRPVVVYESDAGMRAARAFWFLEYLGHPHAQVLDGGFAAWTRGGHAVSTSPGGPKAR